MSFRESIKAFAPGYMLGENFTKLLESVGEVLNGAADRVLLGRMAGIPYAGRAKTLTGMSLQCEPDVLPWHAQDRGIKLYSSEPDASKRYRLSRFRQLHRRRATIRGQLENAQPYFLPNALPKMRIVHQSKGVSSPTTATAVWHTLNPDKTYEVLARKPSNFDFDGAFAKWSRYWPVIYTSGTVLEDAMAAYDDGTTYDDGSTVYDGIVSAVRDDLVDLFVHWKGAHSKLWGLILATDPDSFDPTASPAQDASGWWSLPNGKWGSIIDPTTNEPTRPPSAIWLYDLGQG